MSQSFQRCLFFIFFNGKISCEQAMPAKLGDRDAKANNAVLSQVLGYKDGVLKA
jgi:hypothetical protein